MLESVSRLAEESAETGNMLEDDGLAKDGNAIAEAPADELSEVREVEGGGVVRSVEEDDAVADALLVNDVFV